MGSFIQTQKFSVQRVLERRFRQFLTHGSDYYQLMLSLLQGLFRDVQSATRLEGQPVPHDYRIPLRSVTTRRPGGVSCLSLFPATTGC